MEDKRIKKQFFKKSEQELIFTQEDRNRVFEQIHQPKKKSFISFAPLTISLLALGICLLLLRPLILPENVQQEYTGTDANDAVVKEDKVITTLFSVKDAENRIHLNLLFAYSTEKKTANVLAIPRDTYAPIDGTASYDKLAFAYMNGSEGAESVRKTVSTLFDMPIDYYAVMDLSEVSTWIDSVGGIEYNLPEDIRVRAITQVGIDFESGSQRLNGEEVVVLMMATTELDTLDREHLVKLLNAVIDQTKNTPFTAPRETNMSFDNPVEIDSIQGFSLLDALTPTTLDEKYYVTFEEGYLKYIGEKLTTFDASNRAVLTTDGWENKLYTNKLDKWKNGDKPFADNLLEEMMQQLVQQKIIADNKKGAIMLTPERIAILQQMVEENKELYAHHATYLAILNRWQKGDFSTVDADHNVLMQMQGTKTSDGIATGIASKEQEARYLFQVFAKEEEGAE
ncbi:DUF6241 domain-containing protein [Bacillus ndiopicus]|uniref:DUF6241 domain-containing protein n=1 Tax=Bacillus ndiopicus TaxID=1347368 RepID=UPI0009425108|nr:DUF6241 domain-containing protein [Bacillus ndiopicus]